MENKIKLKNLNKIIIFFLIILLTLAVFLPSDLKAVEWGRITRLLTNNDPEYYAVIETSGDTITAKGRYEGHKVTGVWLSNGVPISDTSFEENEEGFEVSATAKGENGYVGYFGIQLDKAGILAYIIAYDNGWYFPDNGLSVKNAELFDHIRTAAPESSALYLSPDRDYDTVEAVLEQVKALSSEIVGDETDDYQKAKLICHWVAENVYYDLDAAAVGITAETVSVKNVLENRRTTCAGYANTFSALLEAAGIRSVNIKGSTVADEVTFETLTEGAQNHEWTAFWYEEQQRWVYVDPGWCTNNNYENGAFNKGFVDFQYFDITEEALALIHRNDKLEERGYFGALESLKPPTEVLTTPEEETAEASVQPEQTDNTQSDIQPVSPEASTPEETANVSVPQNQEEANEPVNLWLAAVLIILALAVIAAAIIVWKRQKNRKG